MNPRRDHGQFHVNFTKVISPKSVESLLLDNYQTSLSRPVVTFSLLNCEWIDIYCASLFVLWVLELRDRKRNVTVRLPESQQLHDFLVQYGIVDSLRSLGTECYTEKVLSTSRAQRLELAPFYPLTFVGEDELQKLLTDLSTPGRLADVLSSVRDAECVRSGKVRDVVLYELGSNLFDHAAGRGAHFLMSKVAKGYSAATVAKMQQTMALEARPLELAFFKSLGEQPLLEIIIADKGPGIYNTLRSAYRADPANAHSAATANACDVLEYAFCYHSSRRRLNERLAPFAEFLASQNPVVAPPTGLFRLKETIREFRGLLYVRSGSAIVCYDFQSNRYQDKPHRSDAHPGYARLASFGGTQYRILLPVVIQRRPSHHSTLLERVDSQKTLEHSYEYLALAECFDVSIRSVEQRERAFLQRAFDKLNQMVSRKGRPSVVILDGTLDTELSAKAYHVLLLDLLQRQTLARHYVVINLDLAITRLFPASLARYENLGRSPLLTFDEKGRPHFVGASAVLNSLLERVEQQQVAVNQEEWAALEDQSFLVYDTESNRLKLSVSLREATRRAKHAVRAEIAHHLRSHDSGVFQRHARVMLPSEVFVSGYFDLQKLLERPEWRQAVVRWFAFDLMDRSCELVISIGNSVGKIADAAIRQCAARAGGDIEHVNISTPSGRPVSVADVIGRDYNKRVTVLTDVIGTAKSVEAILNAIRGSQESSVVCLVNATSPLQEAFHIGPRQIRVESVVDHPLDYKRQRPPTWSYDTICFVDPLTHALIRPRGTSKGPLWKGPEHREKVGEADETHQINSFFDDVLASANAVLEGHFLGQDKHILYLFDTPAIVGRFASEIVLKIFEDVVSFQRGTQGKQNVRVKRLLFPDFNPGLEPLASLLATKFEGALLMPISSELVASRLAPDIEEPRDEAMIVLDDATETGATLERLIDIAERMGATMIYAYALIQRGGAYSGRRMEKRTAFGNATVHARYLIDVELPLYASALCPVCGYRSDLATCLEHCTSETVLTQHISLMRRQLSLKGLEVVSSEQESTAVIPEDSDRLERLYLRWLIQMAFTTPGALSAVVSRLGDDPICNGRLSQLLHVVAREALLPQLRALSADSTRELFSILAKAIRQLLTNIKILPATQLEPLFRVADEICPEAVLENLHRLSEACLSDESKGSAFLVYVMTSRVAAEHPAIFRAFLEETTHTRQCHNVFQVPVNDARLYLEQRSSTLQRRKEERLAAYKYVRGGKFHEVRHLTADVVSSSEDASTFTSALGSWETLTSEMSSILAMVRKCIAFEVSSAVCVSISKCIESLEFQMETGRTCVERFLASTGKHSGAPVYCSGLGDLGLVAERIRELVDGEQGIRQLLSAFETNIKEVVHNVVHAHEGGLLEAGITVCRNLSEDALIVYGEEPPLRSVIHNLVENVWKASRAKTCEVGAFITMDDTDYVDLYVADDGIGVTADLSFGDGLRAVERAVKMYAGRFKIGAPDPRGALASKGFRTVAEVRLPYLKV